MLHCMTSLGEKKVEANPYALPINGGPWIIFLQAIAYVITVFVPEIKFPILAEKACNNFW